MNCSQPWSQGVRFWSGRHVSKEFTTVSRELGGDRLSWKLGELSPRGSGGNGASKSRSTVIRGRALGWVWSRGGNLLEGNEGKEKGIQHKTRTENRELQQRRKQIKKAGSLRKTVLIRSEKSFQCDHRVSVRRGWSDKLGLYVLLRGLICNSSSNNSKNINTKTVCAQILFYIPCIYYLIHLGRN